MISALHSFRLTYKKFMDAINYSFNNVHVFYFNSLHVPKSISTFLLFSTYLENTYFDVF